MNDEYVLLSGTFLDKSKYEPVIDELLAADKKVCAGLLDPEEDKSDPFAWSKRVKDIVDTYPEAYADGRLVILSIPSIAELKRID